MKTSSIALLAIAAVASAQQADSTAIVACATTVDNILATAATNDGAKACAKEAGFSMDSTDMSDAAIKKYVDAKACQAWWTATVGSIN
ncbi:hypothetical protein As57867_024552, partial [Aphanomyces stellatus]